VNVSSSKATRDLDRAITAEVEQDDGVAVTHARVVADDERRQPLIVDLRVLRVERLDRFARRGEPPTFPAHVEVPAALDHRPLGLVAVHRDEHAAATRGDGPSFLPRSFSSSGRTQVSAERAGTSRPSVSTCTRTCTSAGTWSISAQR
jgi:hypothetical protein